MDVDDVDDKALEIQLQCAQTFSGVSFFYVFTFVMVIFLNIFIGSRSEVFIRESCNGIWTQM